MGRIKPSKSLPMSEDNQTGGDNATAGGDALQNTLRTLLAPMARLAVSYGLPFAAVEDAVKETFIEAARASLLEQGLPAHRLVSRISTITGINRREVTRLTRQAPEEARRTSPSVATEVFTRWVTNPSLKTPEGGHMVLKRQGGAPSFEALARSVTQDVHPRSVLDELCRLGLASLDETTDEVTLLSDTYVPGGDRAHMLEFLGANVGDHLSGAVQNVIGKTSRQHFDQAVFADELADESLPLVRQFVAGQWKRLLEQAVPMLEERIEADKTAKRPQNKRIRIGLYSYDEDTAEPTGPAQDGETES
jgi:hypothetical protein